jgi:hypothetical protein
VGEEHLPGIGQAYEAARTIKERDSTLVFEGFDLLADGRLGEMQMRCRRGKACVRCHFFEGDELP